MYLTNEVITPTLWQTVAPWLYIAASYVPAYVVICFMFPREDQQ